MVSPEECLVKNRYSATWFELFLASPEERQTRIEVDFLTRQLPRERFTTILDVCCGYGRHAAPLGEHGYEVMAIDRDPNVIDAARRGHGPKGVDFQVWDMSRIRDLNRRFDAVICMWQSFGYLDAAANRDILDQIATILNPGGRFIIDIYNASFFESRQGVRSSRRQGIDIVTTQDLHADRLTVNLEYGDGRGNDTFEWQVFTRDSFRVEALSHGLQPLVGCTDFEESQSPGPAKPRMQFVLEKRQVHEPAAHSFGLSCLASSK